MENIDLPVCDIEGTIAALEKTGIPIEIKDVNLDTGEEKIVKALPRSYTNEQMRVMLDSLSEARDSQGMNALDHGDLIGYAAYRNARILRECCTEYIQRVQALGDEYGRPERDAEGNPTGRMFVPRDDPKWDEFEEKMRVWGDIEHRPDIYRIPIGEAVGKLSGTQMLALDWMFEEQ